MKKDFKRRVVIGGLPRSGSTLLRFMLDASGQFITMPETRFFSLPLYQRTGEAFEGYSEMLSERLGVSKEIIVSAVQNNTNSVFAFDEIAHHFSVKVKVPKEFWIEKTPINCFHYHRLSYEVEDVLFISTIRDGRDVVTSVVENHPVYNNSYWCSIQRYIDTMAAVMNFQSPRHLVIRYEDLVYDPQRSLETISHFLGIEVTGGSLDSFYKESPTRDLSKVYQPKLNQPLTTSWVGRWRDKKFSTRVQEFMSSKDATYWQNRAGYAVEAI